MWAAATSLGFGVLATVLASRGRWRDPRLWAAFASGGAVFLAAQVVARPVTALLGGLGAGEAGVPGWSVVAVLGVLAEVFKLTGAVVLHQLYGMGAREGGRVGAAVGAGFATWAEAVILRSAFQLWQLGLPGGVSVASALAASGARLLAGAAATGMGARLATTGRLGAGLAVACAVQLLVDPVVRIAVPSARWAAAATVAVGAGAFAALWWPAARGED